ncbi:hypothetical protein ADUPG1_010299 [Aduncisulcus paluster]|uniref:Uncharacterized protein n=1 Tax=Aduncisulcus paluster TaxID=2918883 RepID=A0ABQ5JQR0_9EUKA|nr:hypothetical protein ADUPG1_010299 [Aduncisulcus paluster]
MEDLFVNYGLTAEVNIIVYGYVGGISYEDAIEKFSEMDEESLDSYLDPTYRAESSFSIDMMTMNMGDKGTLTVNSDLWGSYDEMDLEIPFPTAQNENLGTIKLIQGNSTVGQDTVTSGTFENIDQVKAFLNNLSYEVTGYKKEYETTMTILATSEGVTSEMQIIYKFYVENLPIYYFIIAGVALLLIIYFLYYVPLWVIKGKPLEIPFFDFKNTHLALCAPSRVNIDEEEVEEEDCEEMEEYSYTGEDSLWDGSVAYEENNSPAPHQIPGSAQEFSIDIDDDDEYGIDPTVPKGRVLFLPDVVTVQDQEIDITADFGDSDSM